MNWHCECNYIFLQLNYVSFAMHRLYETELGYKKKKENKETLGNENHLDRITDLDQAQHHCGALAGL